MQVSHHRFYCYGSESGDSDKSICSSDFITKKKWNKDLLSNKGISISQHTSMARAGVKVMIGIKDNDTQGVDL